jgi:hypothetical protein
MTGDEVDETQLNIREKLAHIENQLILEFPLQSTETDRAYAAGLIDGEGSITAYAPSRSPHSFAISVSVRMCDREPIDWLATTFGGKSILQKRPTKSGTPIFEWKLNSRNAAAFLTLIKPHLKVKGKRAAYAIVLASLLKDNKVKVTHVFTTAEITERQALADAIRLANQRTR